MGHLNWFRGSKFNGEKISTINIKKYLKNVSGKNMGTINIKQIKNVIIIKLVERCVDHTEYKNVKIK